MVIVALLLVVVADDVAECGRGDFSACERRAVALCSSAAAPGPGCATESKCDDEALCACVREPKTCSAFSFDKLGDESLSMIEKVCHSRPGCTAGVTLPPLFSIPPQFLGRLATSLAYSCDLAALSLGGELALACHHARSFKRAVNFVAKHPKSPYECLAGDPVACAEVQADPDYETLAEDSYIGWRLPAELKTKCEAGDAAACRAAFRRRAFDVQGQVEKLCRAGDLEACESRALACNWTMKGRQRRCELKPSSWATDACSKGRARACILSDKVGDAAKACASLSGFEAASFDACTAVAERSAKDRDRILKNLCRQGHGPSCARVKQEASACLAGDVGSCALATEGPGAKKWARQRTDLVRRFVELCGTSWDQACDAFAESKVLGVELSRQAEDARLSFLWSACARVDEKGRSQPSPLCHDLPGVLAQRIAAAGRFGSGIAESVGVALCKSDLEAEACRLWAEHKVADLGPALGYAQSICRRDAAGCASISRMIREVARATVDPTGLGERLCEGQTPDKCTAIKAKLGAP